MGSGGLAVALLELLSSAGPPLSGRSKDRDNSAKGAEVMLAWGKYGRASKFATASPKGGRFFGRVGLFRNNCKLEATR